MQDLIGPASDWLQNNRHLWWGRHIGNRGRFMLACFIFIDGLNPTIYYERAELINNIDPNNSHAWDHIKHLFARFENGTRVVIPFIRTISLYTQKQYLIFLFKKLIVEECVGYFII